jgi:pimeloyl-ACP methyl ester carboxylesterase
MQVPLRYRLAHAAVVRSDWISELVIQRMGLFQRLGLRQSLDAESRRIFAAANPDAASRAGIAAFPRMIPTSPARPSFAPLRDLFGRLREWDVPVLVLFSDGDVIFPPRGGRELAERLPNGSFKLVRGARHFVQHDAADEVAREIERFVGSAG